MKTRGLFFNRHDLYQGKIGQIMTNANSKRGVHLDCLKLGESPERAYEMASKSNGYDFLIHRNEHGALFKGGWLQKIAMTDVPLLSFDFGYFGHYNSFMVDFYLRDMSSSINLEWESLSSSVNWNAAPKYIQDYRKISIDKVNSFRGSLIEGIHLENTVTIWMQWNTELLRKELFVDGKRLPQYAWINLIATKIKALGLVPIIKMGIVDHSEIYKDTSPFVDSGVLMVCDKEAVAKSNPRAFFDKNANHKLIANSKYHVLLCSSASNEIVLNEKPIIATGRSWFNGLDIFYEPKSWDDSFSEPEVNIPARNKWINWWLSRQVKLKDTDDKILEVYNMAKTFLSGNAVIDYQI